jgi:hypothetical protein
MPTSSLKLDRDQLPWNKGRLLGQKRPLRPRDVWAILAAAVWDKVSSKATNQWFAASVLERLPNLVSNGRLCDESWSRAWMGCGDRRNLWDSIVAAKHTLHHGPRHWLDATECLSPRLNGSGKRPTLIASHMKARCSRIMWRCKAAHPDATPSSPACIR